MKRTTQEQWAHEECEDLPPVVCAWCDKVLREGGSDCAVSHGICETCAKELEDE